MFKTYKVIYEIIESKNSRPFYRTYCFSCAGGKRAAMRIATDILTEYILDMKYYTGSVSKINVIK